MSLAGVFKHKPGCRVCNSSPIKPLTRTVGQGHMKLRSDEWCVNGICESRGELLTMFLQCYCTLIV
eukprot:scaffold22599_cov139-Cylindrotheca_fusiformis.AAC.33